jgi:hypothetical protein
LSFTGSFAASIFSRPSLKGGLFPQGGPTPQGAQLLKNQERNHKKYRYRNRERSEIGKEIGSEIGIEIGREIGREIESEIGSDVKICHVTSYITQVPVSNSLPTLVCS